jgi:glucokinase
LRLPSTSRKRPTVQEFGELETLLGSAGILESWHETRRAGGGQETMDASGILDLAQAGDGRAEKILQHRTAIVADIVVNLSVILNPGLILLEGKIGSHPALIAGVERQLQDSEFAPPKIGAGELGDSSVLWGGVAIALEEVPSVLLPSP